MTRRTQITGLGPVMPDGSRKIFDKEIKPFIATAAWLDAQVAEPATGDYLDIEEDGSVTLVEEENSTRAPTPAEKPQGQKKTDGETGSDSGLENSQPTQGDAETKLGQDQINSMFEARLARLEIYLQSEGHKITKYDGPHDKPPISE